MSYRWLLHYGYEFISKNLGISCSTVMNCRDFVGPMLLRRSVRAKLLDFICPCSVTRKIHKAKFSFRPRSLCFERCEAISTKHNAIQYWQISLSHNCMLSSYHTNCYNEGNPPKYNSYFWIKLKWSTTNQKFSVKPQEKKFGLWNNGIRER